MARLTEQRISAAPSVGAASTSRRHHLVGRPSNNRNTPENFPARFWQRVERRGDDECWPWLGSKLPSGRGQVHLRYDGTKSVRKNAPVVAWELTHGPIPDGKVLCHRCDDPNCCNVLSHLFVGTQAENIYDCALKGRRNAFGLQKLQVPDVLELRRLAALGASRASLARQFGIAKNTVSQIVLRRTWGWLHESRLQSIQPLTEPRANLNEFTQQLRLVEVR